MDSTTAAQMQISTIFVALTLIGHFAYLAAECEFTKILALSGFYHRGAKFRIII